MSMYNSIEYSNKYTFGISWKYYRVNSPSLKTKVKITVKSPKYGNTKNIEIVLPLKYLFIQQVQEFSQ